MYAPDGPAGRSDDDCAEQATAARRRLPAAVRMMYYVVPGLAPGAHERNVLVVLSYLLLVLSGLGAVGLV